MLELHQHQLQPVFVDGSEKEPDGVTLKQKKKCYIANCSLKSQFTREKTVYLSAGT